AMIAEAQQALGQYRQHLAARDLDDLHRLTSRVSPGWSEDRADFLLHSTLRVPSAATADSANTLYALRFVPRSVVAALVNMKSMSAMFGTPDNAEAERELA